MRYQDLFEDVYQAAQLLGSPENAHGLATFSLPPFQTDGLSIKIRSEIQFEQTSCSVSLANFLIDLTFKKESSFHEAVENT